MDSTGRWVDMGGKTAGQSQSLLGVTIGEEGLDDWEGLGQCGQFPLRCTLHRNAQMLKCSQDLGGAIDIDRLGWRRKECALFHRWYRLQESRQGCRCLHSFLLELLTQCRQVGRIDTDTRQLHLGHCRQTLPLQDGCFGQSCRLQGW